MAPSLLLVDDEEDLLEVLQEYLAAQGYRVVTAATGREALERLATATPFDVALVDWTLPDIGGREVVQAIRDRHPDCRVIVTTGHGAEVVNEAHAGPLDGNIVRKPFTMRTVSTRVAMMLEKARND